VVVAVVVVETLVDQVEKLVDLVVVPVLVLAAMSQEKVELHLALHSLEQ
jgi:acetolactate synthase regulatory subunit